MQHPYFRIVVGTVAVLVVIVVAVVAYVVTDFRNSPGIGEGAPQGSGLSLSSPVFENNGSIPAKYTADGANVSPPLQWQGAPAGTKTYALFVEDQDAPNGAFTHWLIADMPAQVSALPEGIAAQDVVSGAVTAVQGENGFRKPGYGGPQPPAGKPHRYVFRLYALDDSLDMPGGFSKAQFRAAIAHHVLGEATLVGRYGRSQ
jgi:hypothetical protein